MSLLQAENLTKRFGSTQVVKGVSLHIDQEEVVGLLGKNGAGKSTTFKMIMGTLAADSGKVSFLGQDVSSWAMHRRCRAGLGYLAQQEAVFSGLTVEENLLAVLEQLAISRAERRKRCAALLDDYGLSEVRKNRAGLCSGGQKRRLELARALVTQPKLILLDEPFAGVDPIAVDSIRQMVRGIKVRGIAVLITDHNAQQTLNTTDRAYVMNDGLVMKEGSPQELVADPVCRQAYFGNDFRLDVPRGESSPAEENRASAEPSGARETESSGAR